MAAADIHWGSSPSTEKVVFDNVLPSTLNIKTKRIAPGVEMPVISIGTGGLESKKAKEIVTNWLQLGGRGIDTALAYDNQEAIRDAIAEFKGNISRKDLFITTKVPNCNVENIGKKVKMDLLKLGVKYVDLVLIHGPRNGNCSEAWTELEAFFASNEAHAIGVSNFNRTHLEEVLKVAKVKPHVNQIRLNVFENNPETIDFSTSNGITIQSYSPLGRNGTRGFDIPGNPLIERIAESHNVTTYQVAMKWVIQHGWVLTFQSSSKDHQAIDADVFGFELTQGEMIELDGLSKVIDSSSSSVTSSSLSSRQGAGEATGCSAWNCHRTTLLTIAGFLVIFFVGFVASRCRRRKKKRSYRLGNTGSNEKHHPDGNGDGIYNDDTSKDTTPLGDFDDDGLTRAELEMI